MFAYGATGAGKTHTMLGTADDPGITYLTAADLYRRALEKADVTVDFRVSYLEVMINQFAIRSRLVVA